MRRKQLNIIWWVLFIVMIWLIVYATASYEKRPEVCFGSTCYDVEIADEPDERSKWLMWREKLADDAWMIFIFEEPGITQFWMKNTLIPLDILRINEQFRIIHIEKNVPPCTQDPCPTYGPTNKNSKYVLEINAWQADKYDLRLDRQWSLTN